MADIGSLGQPGGAGGVYVKCAIRDGDGAQLGPDQRRARLALDRAVDARKVCVACARRYSAMHPDADLLGEARAHARDGGGKLGRRDDVLGCDDIDAMGEPRALEAGIEERHHAPDPRHPEPDRQILRPVRHHEADRIALGHSQFERPARIAVGAGGELPVAHGLPLGKQRRGVAEGGTQLLDHGRQRAPRMGGDRRRGRQCAQPGLGGGIRAFRSRRRPFEFEHAHGRPLPGLPIRGKHETAFS